MNTKKRSDQIKAGVAVLPSLVLPALMLSYIVLIFSVPVYNVFGWSAAKTAFSGVILIPVLCCLFYSRLIRGEAGLFVPAIVRLFGAYVFFLAVVTVVNHGRGYDPLHYLSWYVLAISLILALCNLVDDEKKIRIAVVLMGGVAGVVSVLGVMEYFGLIFYRLNFHSGQNVIATFGNQNYLGGYVCVCISFTLTLFFIARGKLLKIIAAVMSVCVIVCALMTGSRMTLVTVVCSSGFYFFLAGFFLLHPVQRFRSAEARTKITVVALCVVTTVILAWWFVTDGRLISRFADILDPEKFFGIRLPVYRAAVDIWLETPLTVIFGNGLDSYYKQSEMVFSPDMRALVSFDHVHNELLENLVEGGIIGAGIYISMVLLTLGLLLRVVRNESLARSMRLIGIAFITAITAFQFHGIFSISTRTLAVSFTYYWVMGLAWAYCAINECSPRVRVVKGAFAGGCGFVLIVLLLCAGVNLGNDVLTDSLITKAAEAKRENRLADAERFYQDILAIDANHIEGNYFLAHMYLSNQITEGFYTFASRTESIIPRYRTITYFRAVMALLEKRYEAAKELFVFFDTEIKRDDPVTLYWLTMLSRKDGEDERSVDYLKRYFEAVSGDRYTWTFGDGDQVEVVEKGKKEFQVFMGDDQVKELVAEISVSRSPVVSYRHASEKFAECFDGVDFNLWAKLYGQSLEGETSQLMVDKYVEELGKRVDDYRSSGRREDLEDVMRCYEGVITYGPDENELNIRRQMLPYYLKAMRYKHFSFYKKEIKSAGA